MNEAPTQDLPLATAGSDVSRRRAARILLLILALGLSLRVYHAVRAVIISPDSAVFIAYARQLGEAPLAAAREYAGRQHPLYPALILAFHEPIRWVSGDGAAGWILAGRIAAIIGGLGAILAMYWLSARLMDRRRALIAAAMLAVLPDACRVGADVLSDLPHLAFYVAGLAALLTGMQTGRSRFVVLCAAGASLAFLTRPEGASVLVAGLAVVLLHGAWRFRRRLGLALAMLGVFAAVAAPYQLATGKLISKKSPLELFKFGVTESRSFKVADQRGEWLLSVGVSPRSAAVLPRSAAALPRSVAALPRRGLGAWPRVERSGTRGYPVPKRTPPRRGGGNMDRGQAHSQAAPAPPPLRGGMMSRPYPRVPLRSTRGYAPAPLRGESLWDSRATHGFSRAPVYHPPSKGGRQGGEVCARTELQPSPSPSLAGRGVINAVRGANLPVPVNILRQWFRAGRVIYILLAIIGLIAARPRGVGGRVLGFAIGLHLTLLYALEMRYGYLDRRHALILAALSLPLAAEGVWWLANRISGGSKRLSETVRTRAVLGILAVCVLATGYWLVRPVNGEEHHVAAAARWLARNTQPADEIVTDDRLHRVALCADRKFVRWPWWDGKVRDLARFLADKPACYFVVDREHITQPERNSGFFSDLEAGLGGRLELVDVERSASGAPGAEIRIYRCSSSSPQ